MTPAPVQPSTESPSPATERLAPTDEAARDRIRSDLESNLLIEAGAGSGKTTVLVDRMVALVRSDVEVARIAAVTFTRKAAGELSQRFRGKLEREHRRAVESGDPAAGRLGRALAEIDRGFIGTIHAFCARLLRERPLAAGVDPDFREAGAEEEDRLRADFWTGYLEDLHAADDPVLIRLRKVGIDPQELGPRSRRRAGNLPAAERPSPEAFRDVVADPDVDLPGEEVPLPKFGVVRAELESLLDRAGDLLPSRPLGTKGWDDLQKILRRLRFLRENNDWGEAIDFFDALELVPDGGCAATLIRWVEDKEGKDRVRDLKKDFKRFACGPAREVRDAWYAHRYAVVLEFLRPLREAFAAYRRSSGQLTFNDLLMLAADLLRRDPPARRELGRRYRRLLVDEFQDTDPLQAEVCLLLASPPEEGNDWRAVRPRPGALFVVGDPKQSIYRFRRADIELYGAVRARFREFGEVLELTRNFRSRPAIGAFVDAAFRELLPATATPEQAAFAPLNTRDSREPGRVLRYELRPPSHGPRAVRLADAQAVASWIARRVESEERRPKDFLVLPYHKAALGAYARELEKRNIPATTTGAGLTVELELQELLILLEALADPGNAVWILAVLEGFFFGLDPGQLWEYRRERGFLSFERGEFDRASPVGRALATLQGWYDICRRLPIDTALTHIVQEIGLLPLAAGGEMAESRAGSLVHALDVIAAGAKRGATDLRSAIGAIESAMRSLEVEAPLRPGLVDAVRIMNLHKAKGLEAPVVILPHPTGPKARDPDKHVRRKEDGPPEAYFHFRKPFGQGTRTIAKPLGWDAWVDRERAFAAAEHDRVLYVAATRCREELVVATCEASQWPSPWGRLHGALGRFAAPIEIAVNEPPQRSRPELTLREVTARATEVEAARARAAEPAYAACTVTSLSHEELAFEGGGGRGRDWGTIVHAAIAAMGRGRSGDALRRYCRALLLGGERRVDPAGEPSELEGLMALLATVRSSPTWGVLAAAGDRRWELSVARLERAPGEVPRLVTGVIDAAAIGRAGEAWRIVDWKTDAAEGTDWAARERHYEQQVAKYGEVLAALVGVQVEGRVERVR
jgi:ATP-dependent helicase/nuclease subunit A